MSRIVKNTMLEYIPTVLKTEININPNRIFELNSQVISNGDILYLCDRELRAKDNFALDFAIKKSNELNKQLKIIYPKINYEYKPKQYFINKQIQQLRRDFIKRGVDFEIINSTNIINYIKKINPAILIIDFNPLVDRNYLFNFNCKIYEIDGHNIIPAKFISNKQEYNAMILRRKIYYNIFQFLTEYNNDSVFLSEADIVLNNFIKNKLPYYNELKNNPNFNVTSQLSKYINLGFISSQRIAIEIINSNVTLENKEAFLEELIVRKELADNFCLYNKNYKSFNGLPNWAKISLISHQNDMRHYIYSQKELELAKTHDTLWNATQKELLKDGKIHGYLRMYWAKKILEWSENYDTAIQTAVYLNDKYAFDAPSPNGYVGILWAIGGLHDKPFQDYPITGKIRRMSYNSLIKKFDIIKYINNF